MLFLICYTVLRFFSKGKNQSQLKISGFLNGFAAKLHANLFSRFILILMPLMVYPQASLYNYKIMYKGDNIGWMKLEKNVDGHKSDMSLVSEIKTRVVVPVRIHVEELSTFENGKLVFSSQLRKTNGKVKTDSQTKLIDNKYEMTENGVRNRFPLPAINANLLSLFFEEPVAKDLVFVEKQQRFLRIVKTDDGGYQLKFPNGNKNCFYYSRGICTKIKVQHNLYAVEVIFTP